jgi:hypothetical protein
LHQNQEIDISEEYTEDAQMMAFIEKTKKYTAKRKF